MYHFDGRLWSRMDYAFMKQTINYIPVLNLLLITDSLGLHTICIFTENHLEGSKVCFWVANRSLDLITIGSAIYCNAFFPQLGRTNVADLRTCSDDNIWCKFRFGSYIPRRRLESVITKCLIHTGVVTDSYTFTSLDSSALDWSRARVQPT